MAEHQTSRETLLRLHQADLGEAEASALLSVLESGWLTKGPRTREFEQSFGHRIGAGHCLGMNSCTAALHTALLAAGIGPGDEVIVPALTFAATANVVVHCGATPVFADVLPDTHCIDPQSAAQLVSERTRAIIPVHFAGIPCEMDSLHALADRHGLWILEDCAHAIETEYRGRPVGVAGGSRFAAYSFYATKNLICGEGGLLACREAEDLEQSTVIGLHGMSADAWKRYSGEGFRLYDIVAAGFKYNMFDLQAALGLVQLAKLDANWQRRRAIVKRYDEALAAAFPDGELSGLSYPDYGKSAHHLYLVRLREDLAHRRNGLIEELLKLQVQAYVHYPCLSGTQFYRERFGSRLAETPVAASLSERSITLPLFPQMQPEDADYVVGALRSLLA